MSDNRIIGKRLSLIPVKEIITINKKGLKHLMSRNYGKDDNKIVRINLVKNILKILSDAVYVSFEANTKPNNFTKGVHNFYSIAVYQQKIYEVWIKIKETRDLTFVYDIGIIREM